MHVSQISFENRFVQSRTLAGRSKTDSFGLNKLNLFHACRAIFLVLLFFSWRPALAQNLQSLEDSSVQTAYSPADRSLLESRLTQLNHDIMTRGLRYHDGSRHRLVTGYAYYEFFDWDLYFDSIYLSYYGVNQPLFSNLQAFLSRQEQNGFISRTMGLTVHVPKQMFKPFLAQLVVLGAKQRGNDYEWVRGDVYIQLQRYLDRWFEYDGDHNGLPVWNSSDASGMDNQFSRSGQIDSYRDEGVDLACYLFRELQAMAVIANRLGRVSDRNYYEKHARKMAKLINKVFWDPEAGFYFDRDEQSGKRVKVKSVAGFLPLWAGVAPASRARRLIQEHLLNKKEFWLSFPVSTYARTEPDFYEGSVSGECNWRGSTWIPANYMIFHGLLDYGYQKIAYALARKSLTLALLENPATREYYDSESGAGLGMNPFWGWSSLAYIMPLEFVLHYNPTALREDIRPIVKDHLGIKITLNEIKK